MTSAEGGEGQCRTRARGPNTSHRTGGAGAGRVSITRALINQTEPQSPLLSQGGNYKLPSDFDAQPGSSHQT